MYVVHSGLFTGTLRQAIETVVKLCYIIKYNFPKTAVVVCGRWFVGSCMFSVIFFPPSSFLDSRQQQCHMSDCEIRWSIYNFKIFVTQLSRRDPLKWVEHKGWQTHHFLPFGFYCSTKTQSFCPQNQSYAHCAIKTQAFFFFASTHCSPDQSIISKPL